jgi:hypothetical protein
MNKLGLALLGVFACLSLPLFAQVDPVKRDFFEIGGEQPFQGANPLSVYAYYYHNQPNFLQTNLTLRLVVAPTYVDSELGFIGLLGPNTDVGIGLAGGGFADDYNEFHDGKFWEGQSFDGDGTTISGSIYHLVNPGDLIPLNYLLRGSMHYAAYEDDDTAGNFVLPANQTSFNVRTGLRFGGIEPTLSPALAMEISVWYEGQFRTDPNSYGFNDDRHVNAESHLFWTREALDYTFTNSQQRVGISFQAGASIDSDRFSAYRLGGELPLASEFPLSLPGYFYPEFSAGKYVIANADYTLPIDEEKHWNLRADAATAAVDYVGGTGQPGTSLSSVGGGVLYRAKDDRWKVILDYGYGLNAIRGGDGHGASSISLLVQLDLDKIQNRWFHPLQPGFWNGLKSLF